MQGTMKRTIPLAAMEKLLKKAGANRVADQAKEQLREILEDIALEIGKQSLGLAQHAGRTTIKAEDVKLAAKNL